MYCPKTFPANAFRLDRDSLRITEITMPSPMRMKVKGGESYVSASSLFVTRGRAVAAARTRVKQMESDLAKYAKRLESMRAKLAALEASK